MPHYVYFQKMDGGAEHSLWQHVNSLEKLRGHLLVPDRVFVLAELAILPQQRFAYGMKNLHLVSHGSETVVNMANIAQILVGEGIPHFALPRTGRSGCHDMTQS